MFPIAHAQAQTSIAKYQFVSPGLLVSLSSALTMSYRKYEFRLNKGYIEASCCRFWMFSAVHFLCCSVKTYFVLIQMSMC